MIERPSEMFDNPPLAGLRIGISGAIPEREHWGGVGDLDRLILTFVAQLSALVVRYGGHLVHGSQPLLTPVVAEQVRLQSHTRNGALTLVASQLFGPIPDVTQTAAEATQALILMTAKQGEGGVQDTPTRNKSLTAMRLALMPEIDVLVAIGGKLHTETKFNPGVLEELAMARWHGLPAFVIGAFGGVAGELEQTIVEELSRSNLLEDGGQSMAQWHENMDRYVGKLLAHLIRHQEEFTARQRREVHEVSPFRLVEEPKDRVRVVEVEPRVVDAWQFRFAGLFESLEHNDVARAQGLLRT